MQPASSNLPERKDNGGFVTADKNERQFMKAFDQIRGQQYRRRQSAKRTLTPAQLRDMKPKDIARLGQRADGLPFTEKDLKDFQKAARKYPNRKISSDYGITYAEIVVGSTEIDIKRANNQVNDGTGITTANLVGMRKGNTVAIRVKASMGSKHDDHRVMLRLEEWDTKLMLAPKGKKGYQKATKEACAGRMSIQCSCGRFQYWYRYQATIGQYVLSPPKEHAFPKLRNPKLRGVACKHILKATAKLQSVTWQRRIAVEMEKQAQTVGFGGRGSFTVNAKDKKNLAKAKKDKTDIDQARVEYQRYKARQQRFDKKRKATPKEIRDGLKRIRKREKELDRKERQLDKKLQRVAKHLSDSEKIKQQAEKDGRLSDAQKEAEDNRKLKDFATLARELEQAGGLTAQQRKILGLTLDGLDK